MFVLTTYRLWTTGSFTASYTVGLDRRRRYLVTGGLVGKEGDDYAQIFISTVCTMLSSDVIGCGVRDDPSASPKDNIQNFTLRAQERLGPDATRVTIKLRSDGGRHRAEGVIYDII
jgi:hypothetical protein